MHDAAPEATATAEHSVAAPSRNVTVPVGAAPLDEIVAVNVTDWPTRDGFTDDVTPTVLAATFTFCVVVATAVECVALPE